MAGKEAKPPEPPSTQTTGPRQQIQAYGGGAFRISGVRHEGSVLILAERTQAGPPAHRDHLGGVAGAADPGNGEAASDAGAGFLVIIGCGEKFVPMPPALRADLAAAGIHAEWMGTGAACRTFNVLVGEGRAVRAALLAVD